MGRLYPSLADLSQALENGRPFSGNGGWEKHRKALAGVFAVCHWYFSVHYFSYILGKDFDGGYGKCKIWKETFQRIQMVSAEL